MNFDQLKSKYLASRSQFILLDRKGKVLESCDSLFTPSGSSSIFQHHPFLESVKEVVLSLVDGDTIDYPCIRTNFFGRQGYFDISFKRIEKNRILWISTDQTDFYSTVIPLQQERNELDIQEEFLKIRQKAITLEKRLLRLQNEELKRVKKFKEDFFAQVSHEMRVPLNSILGLAHLIQENQIEMDDDEPLSALIDTSYHLASIVDDVLELSKIEAGKAELDLVEFELEETLDSVLNSFSYSISSKNIRLIKNVEPGVPRAIKGDRKKLTQILFNLIGNAVKYTSQGSVELKVGLVGENQAPKRLSFVVSDTGIGISAKDQKTLFQPYDRGKGDNARFYGGTGLGLSIVHRMTEFLGGSISVQSQVGQGTVVSVELPYQIAIGKKIKTAIKKANQPLVHLRNVLVGEDDLLNQKVVNNWLIKWGLKPTNASDGVGVQEHLNSGDYDLCILDYQLPDKTGLEIVQEMRSAKKELPPVIMLTGRSIPKLVTGKSKDLFEEIILKPFDPDQLFKCIQRIDNLADSKGSVLIDLTNLKKITRNNLELIEELVGIFNGTVPQLIQEMNVDLRNKDWPKLKKALHRIGPNLEYVGSTKVLQVLDELERVVKGNKSPKRTKELLHQLETYTTQIVKELSKTKKEFV